MNYSIFTLNYSTFIQNKYVFLPNISEEIWLSSEMFGKRCSI